MNRLIISFITFTIYLSSCSNQSHNLTVSGTIEGLRKGTLYFQKSNDTTIVTIDSLTINGNPDFTFSTNINSPEVLTLYLNKNDGNSLNDQLDFFAEAGTITINTSWDYFMSEAKITGSKSHDTWEEFKKVNGRFANTNLMLIKDIFEAEKQGNKKQADSLRNVSQKNSTRSYLYTLNFVINNKDSYVAPYLLLANMETINPKYLDSLNNTLPNEIKQSKYGMLLNEYIRNLQPKNDLLKNQN